MRISTTLLTTLFIFLTFMSCKKQEEYDVVRFGYTSSNPNVEIKSGGQLSLYDSYSDFGVEDNAIYTASADQELKIEGTKATGFENMTNTANLTSTSTNLYYVHAILDDTLSNLTFQDSGYANPMSLYVGDYSEEESDEIVFLANLTITYENWWRNSQWQLTSTTVNGTTGNLVNCAIDNKLEIEQPAGLDMVRITYDEGNDVCNGVTPYQAGQLFMNNTKSRTLACEFELDAGSGRIEFFELQFLDKNTIRLNGISNGTTIQYTFDRI